MILVGFKRLQIGLRHLIMAARPTPNVHDRLKNVKWLANEKFRRLIDIHRTLENQSELVQEDIQVLRDRCKRRLNQAFDEIASEAHHNCTQNIRIIRDLYDELNLKYVCLTKGTFHSLDFEAVFADLYKESTRPVELHGDDRVCQSRHFRLLDFVHYNKSVVKIGKPLSEFHGNFDSPILTVDGTTVNIEKKASIQTIHSSVSLLTLVSACTLFVQGVALPAVTFSVLLPSYF